MTTVQTTPNPFALLMDPEPILAAIACSERLARLTSRVFRPLDKPSDKPSVARPSVAPVKQLEADFGQLPDDEE